MSEYIAKCSEVVSVSGKPLTIPDYIDTSKEIVRCKNCKHYIAPGSIHFDDGTTNLGACSIVRAYMVKITPDGFCAWGERKSADD